MGKLVLPAQVKLQCHMQNTEWCCILSGQLLVVERHGSLMTEVHDCPLVVEPHDFVPGPESQSHMQNTEWCCILSGQLLMVEHHGLYAMTGARHCPLGVEPRALAPSSSPYPGSPRTLDCHCHVTWVWLQQVLLKSMLDLLEDWHWVYAFDQSPCRINNNVTSLWPFYI